MDPLETFLGELLHEGKVVFSDRPPAGEAFSPAAMALLEDAFGRHASEVAGPPIAFDAGVAREAAMRLRRACWALISRDERPSDLLAGLVMPHRPETAAHHLSADLLFLYLPQVHRRAKGLDPLDALTTGLAALLRDWPLSGVLGDLDEGPASPPNLAGHPGLCLLYAERFARREREAWEPSESAMEYVELVRAGEKTRD